MQTCIIHLIRNTFRLTSRKYRDEIKRDIKPIYTAVNAAVARSAFDELAHKWRQWATRAVIRLWDNAWSEFIPFLDYDVEIRRVICSTNSIESLTPATDERSRRAGISLRAGRDECLYLVTRSLTPHRRGQGTMDDAVEASAQRVRHHLRRPFPGGRNLLMKTAGNTGSEIVPIGWGVLSRGRVKRRAVTVVAARRFLWPGWCGGVERVVSTRCQV